MLEVVGGGGGGGGGVNHGTLMNQNMHANNLPHADFKRKHYTITVFLIIN